MVYSLFLLLLSRALALSFRRRRRRAFRCAKTFADKRERFLARLVCSNRRGLLDAQAVVAARHDVHHIVRTVLRFRETFTIGMAFKSF